jgi:hypothetical protein
LKQRAYNLRTPQQLIVQGQAVGTIERIDYYDRINGLRINYKDGRKIDLPSAVDISEQLEEPRILVVEGVDPHRFFIFGGEIAFWLSTDLTQIDRLDLFRKHALEEYWTTTVFEQPQAIIVIYEVGVLVIGETLQVLLHREKLINDFFVAIEDNALKFLRDHDEEWLLPLDYSL